MLVSFFCGHTYNSECGLARTRESNSHNRWRIFFCPFPSLRRETTREKCAGRFHRLVFLWRLQKTRLQPCLHLLLRKCSVRKRTTLVQMSTGLAIAFGVVAVCGLVYYLLTNHRQSLQSLPFVAKRYVVGNLQSWNFSNFEGIYERGSYKVVVTERNVAFYEATGGIPEWKLWKSVPSTDCHMYDNAVAFLCICRRRILSSISTGQTMTLCIGSKVRRTPCPSWTRAFMDAWLPHGGHGPPENPDPYPWHDYVSTNVRHYMKRVRFAQTATGHRKVFLTQRDGAFKQAVINFLSNDCVYGDGHLFTRCNMEPQNMVTTISKMEFWKKLSKNPS